MTSEEKYEKLSVSLEKHYDKVIADQKELMISKFEGIDKAISKADEYTRYRDEKQNEFRGSLDDVNQRLADQSKTFATKTDLDNLNDKFNIWMSGTRQVAEANFGVAMDAIRALKEDVERIKNLKQGSNIVWPWVITIIMGLIGTISFILMMVTRLG